MLKYRNIFFAILLSFFITSCSSRTIEYRCTDKDFSAEYSSKTNNLTFKNSLNNENYTFSVNNHKEAGDFFDDIDLKENQYIITLLRVGKNVPQDQLIVITEDEYPYFLSPKGSNVTPKKTTSSENAIFYFVMPCYTKKSVN